jgi:hypothetical protein
LAYLKEAKRVIGLINEALQQNQLEAIQAALDQSNHLELDYSEIKSAELIEHIEKAVHARDAILRKTKARKQLNDAVISEELYELKWALAEAKAAGIDEEKLYGEGVELLQTLEHELKVMEDLANSVQSGE